MTVDQLIKALGGQTAVAAALDAPVTTVHAWTKNGVPRWYVSRLVEMAANIGIAVAPDAIMSVSSRKAQTAVAA